MQGRTPVQLRFPRSASPKRAQFQVVKLPITLIFPNAGNGYQGCAQLIPGAAKNYGEDRWLWMPFLGLACFRGREITLFGIQAVPCSLARFGKANFELMPPDTSAVSTWRIPKNVAVAEFTIDLGDCALNLGKVVYRKESTGRSGCHFVHLQRSESFFEASGEPVEYADGVHIYVGFAQE